MCIPRTWQRHTLLKNFRIYQHWSWNQGDVRENYERKRNGVERGDFEHWLRFKKGFLLPFVRKVPFLKFLNIDNEPNPSQRHGVKVSELIDECVSLGYLSEQDMLHDSTLSITGEGIELSRIAYAIEKILREFGYIRSTVSAITITIVGSTFWGSISSWFKSLLSYLPWI